MYIGGRRVGITNTASALVIVIIVLAATVGLLSYQYASSPSTQSEATTTTTVQSTVTSTQTTTITVVTNVSMNGQRPIPANFPKTCLTNFPTGFNLNSSTYFIITNFTMNFAQICIKYTYYPQNDTSLTTNGKYNASFGGAMFSTDSFGNATQGGSSPNGIAIPQHIEFNSTGDSAIVVYDIQWSLIFSNFIPSYTMCGTPLFGIGIAQTNGDGSSGINLSCPAQTASLLFVAQLVGTSYLKPAIG